MKTHKDDIKTTSIGLNDKDEITIKQEQDVSALIDKTKKNITTLKLNGQTNCLETKWHQYHTQQ